MVEDLKKLADYYKHPYGYAGLASDFFERMSLNYEALAQALAERKPFEAVA